MALGFYITGKEFAQEKYDTTTGQLEEAGAGAMGSLERDQHWPLRSIADPGRRRMKGRAHRRERGVRLGVPNRDSA
jgi:hypothetical protein